MSNSKHKILIIGGGTAGITVAAQLKNKDSKLDIAIIEPSEKHYYQPAWTLVGANTFDFNDTVRNEKDLIPEGVKWIKQYADTIDAANNTVTLRNGDVITYDYLVPCPGIQINLDGIEGLKDAIGKGGVCSNYVDPKYTWEVLKNFKGGNAVFTQPTTPIKCGGAPQKIMYLAADHFDNIGVKDKTNIIFATPGGVIFGVKEFAKTLMQVIARHNIHLKTFYAPVKIDAEKKLVHFKWVSAQENECIINKDDLNEEHNGESEIIMPYDMLHLAPPQSAPDFIRNSPLANEGGWIDVDINTLQHKKYSNVFALGDAAALPTAKTGAAIRKQAPVLVANLMHIMGGKEVSEKYEGYSSCPLVTGYGKMVLAEFKYNNVRDSDPTISKFVDTTKENWSMWILKKYLLPYFYWNKMLKGKG